MKTDLNNSTNIKGKEKVVPRESVTEEELVKIINSKLSKYEECKDCHVSGIMGSEEDNTGCNWSRPFLTCSGVPARVCEPIANGIINEIRQQYNLNK